MFGRIAFDDDEFPEGYQDWLEESDYIEGMQFLNDFGLDTIEALAFIDDDDDEPDDVDYLEFEDEEEDW